MKILLDARVFSSLYRVKVIAQSQLGAVVILLFTELGVFRSCYKTGLQTHLEVCNPRIENLRRKGKAFITDVVYACDRRGKIKDVEGFLLRNAQV